LIQAEIKAMVKTHILTHGLIYGGILNGYLLLFMITFSPRVWGYKDYPDVIKKKVPAQTRKEKILGVVVGLPWFLFVLGFPVFSTFALKSRMGDEISFLTAFLNVFVMVLLGTLGDLVLLDWLLISKITPPFVIIPGTVKEDYRDFSHHYKGHARASVPLIVFALIIAGLVHWI
jgi:hypothetical protein